LKTWSPKNRDGRPLAAESAEISSEDVVVAISPRSGSVRSSVASTGRFTSSSSRTASTASVELPRSERSVVTRTRSAAFSASSRAHSAAIRSTADAADFGERAQRRTGISAAAAVTASPHAIVPDPAIASRSSRASCRFPPPDALLAAG
jgi:hypothetical protein